MSVCMLSCLLVRYLLTPPPTPPGWISNKFSESNHWMHQRPSFKMAATAVQYSKHKNCYNTHIVIRSYNFSQYHKRAFFSTRWFCERRQLNPRPLIDYQLYFIHNVFPSKSKRSTNLDVEVEGQRSGIAWLFRVLMSVICALLMAYVKCHPDRAH